MLFQVEDEATVVCSLTKKCSDASEVHLSKEAQWQAQTASLTSELTAANAVLMAYRTQTEQCAADKTSLEAQLAAVTNDVRDAIKALWIEFKIAYRTLRCWPRSRMCRTRLGHFVIKSGFWRPRYSSYHPIS